MLTIIEPGDPVITVEETKAYLRLSGAADDAVIERLIAAVTGWAAGPQGFMGRALTTTTLELTVASFITDVSEGLILPRPPFVSVTSVKYLDPDENEQTLSDSVYRVLLGSLGLSELHLRSGQSWPSIAWAPDAVRIRYVAGYGDDAEDVPEGLRQALIMAVARLYESGGDFIGSPGDDPWIRRLFWRYRVFT
jgi:uncharacterized phiE125 gp8 family phage protein